MSRSAGTIAPIKIKSHKGADIDSKNGMNNNANKKPIPPKSKTIVSINKILTISDGNTMKLTISKMHAKKLQVNPEHIEAFNI